MTAPQAIMLSLIFFAGMLILWLLAVEAFEEWRKKRRTAYEKHLDEIADEADRRSRETAHERFGR